MSHVRKKFNLTACKIQCPSGANDCSTRQEGHILLTSIYPYCCHKNHPPIHALRYTRSVDSFTSYVSKSSFKVVTSTRGSFLYPSGLPTIMWYAIPFHGLQAPPFIFDRSVPQIIFVPIGLKPRSTAFLLLGSQIRTPLKVRMLVSCLCCVFCR